MAATFSLNEAGFLTGQSTAAINRAIDRNEIDAYGAREKNGARRIGRTELRTLAVIGAIGKDLTPAGRRKISAAVRRLGADESRVDVGVIGIDLDDLDSRITERLFRLETIRQLVDPQEDGDPLIRGTRLSVYEIAALASGRTNAEIIEDCSGLTSEQIEAAVKYASVYPRSGRPPQPRSLKKVLSDMATSGVWDVETDDGPVIL